MPWWEPTTRMKTQPTNTDFRRWARQIREAAKDIKEIAPVVSGTLRLIAKSIDRFS